MNPYLAFAIFFPPAALFIWITALRPMIRGIRDSNNMTTAKRELPMLASKLNLSTKKNASDKLDSYIGQWKGHKIRIKPHDNTAVGIKLKNDPRIDLQHNSIAERPPFDIRCFSAFVAPFLYKFMGVDPSSFDERPTLDFGDEVLDKYFKVRRLNDSSGGERIMLNPEVQKVLKEFIEKNHPAVRALHIDTEVSCSLWVGSSSSKSWYYSVTGNQVVYMLSAMLPIVEAIEKAME